MKAFYNENKNREIKVVQNSEVKRGKPLETIEDFERAKKTLCFALDEDKMVVAHVPESGIVTEAEVITPPMRLMYGNSLTGLGGRPILEGGVPGKRSFSANLVSGPLYHPEIDEDNKDKRRAETVEAMFSFLEEVKLQAVLLKLQNSEVHVVNRKNGIKMVRDRMGADFDKNVDLRNEELFIMFYTRFNFPVHSPSENAKKYYGEHPERKELKLTKADFIEYKDKKKTVTIDPRIMDIYNAGENDNNPDYEFAKEVVDSKALNKQFIPLNISHYDRSVKFGPFGPYCGHDSTVSFKLTFKSYAQRDLDGIGFYISSGIVLIGEYDISGGQQLGTDYVVNKSGQAHHHQPQIDVGEKRDAGEYVVNTDAKRQKTDTE